VGDLWTPPVTDDDFTDIGHVETRADEGPQIRLLRCTHCKTLEELPDYQGDPRDDVVLDHLVMDHQRKHPFHDQPDAYLLRVSEKAWRNPKIGRKIHEKIWSDLKEQGTLGGFVPEYYATKSTFHEDAVKCHVQHNRQVPCIDWHADRKRIGNPTKEGWKRGEVKVYLCDFCPVAAKVMEARRAAAGQYDD
jgi:hypothetical protein